MICFKFVLRRSNNNKIFVVKFSDKIFRKSFVKKFKEFKQSSKQLLSHYIIILFLSINSNFSKNYKVLAKNEIINIKNFICQTDSKNN